MHNYAARESEELHPAGVLPELARGQHHHLFQFGKRANHLLTQPVLDLTIAERWVETVAFEPSPDFMMPTTSCLHLFERSSVVKTQRDKGG